MNKEIKNGVVKSVQGNGTFESRYGTMYKFEVSFEDGTVGEYSSKYAEQNKFEVGAKVDYEFTGGQYPKVKPVYDKPAGGGGNKFTKDPKTQEQIIRQSMLKASVDFWAIDPKLKPSVEDVLKVAERFVTFVKGNDDTQFSKEFITPEKTEAIKRVKNLMPTTSSDDLPF